MSDTKHQIRLASWLLAAALCGAVFAASGIANAAEQKIALVIGNSAYPSAPLRNPVNDANAMAEKLKSLGFEVILRNNVTQKEMNRAVVQFGQKLTGGSVGLFYFAGHGLQVRGKNFLIPIDAEIESESAVRSESVDVDQVLEQFSSSRLSMVILDACRNNPFERRFRAAQGTGLAQIDAPKGTLIAYATAPGKTASDGTGVNGLYTQELLRALDAPGAKVEDVFKQTRINVARATQDQQIPWEASSLTGEFFFRAPAPVAANDAIELKKSEQERTRLARELEEERKKRSQDSELIRAEMEKLRAELALIRVAAVPPSTANVTPSAETGKSGSVPSNLTIAKNTSAETTGAASKQGNLPTQQAAETALSPERTAVWRERIGVLERSDHLTFAKAMSILLDVSNPEDLLLMVTMESEISRMGFQNAFAIGAGSNGKLLWAGTWNWGKAEDAQATSIEQCARVTGDSCGVVITNGEFQPKAFINLARQFGAADVDVVRRDYLSSIRTLPRPVTFRWPHGWAYGYSSRNDK